MSLISVESGAQAPASVPQPYSTVPAQPVLFVVNALRRRRWLILAIVALATVVSIAILQKIPPRYTATVMLTVEGASLAPTGIPTAQETVVTQEKINTLMQILASEAIAREVVRRLQLKNDPEFNPYLEEPSAGPSLDADTAEVVVAQEVMEGVSVSSELKSYVVYFSFESVDPQKAAQIANTFTEAFLDLQLESKFKASQQTAAWFNQRITELRQSVRMADERVEAHKELEKLHEVAGETITSQQLVEVNRQLIEARAARAQAEARLRQINQLVSAGDVESAPEVLSSPLIFALRQREADLERRLGEAAELYGERHPKMIALTAERRDLRAKISVEVRRIVSALSYELNVARSREATLQQTLSELEAKIEEASRAEVKLAALQRDSDTERVVLEAFLQRTTETFGQEELQRPDARLFAAAHPPVSPSSPIKVFYLGMAITWGLVLGMLTALGLEYFERKFSSERDVENATGSQPLAMVPELSSWIGRRRLDVHWLARDPQTPYSDAINSVRGGLRFIRPAGRVPSVIMVSSAASGEGKSTFSASLATAAARSGQSVILVDADLRRPAVARTFKVKPQATVVDVLMGRESLEDALIRVEQGRLNLLCAGAPQGGVSPVDVFEKAALETLLDLLRSRFDLVVVDTPPINAVSDALLFASYVDVVLFLIRWRHTNSEIVMNAMRQLYDAGAPCVRCILSRINLQRYRLYGTKDYSYYRQVKVG